VSGRFERVGGPGINDANTLGAHLITGLAFSGFMLLGLRGKRRWLALAATPFILNGIILTMSRGAFLGILGAGPAAWYLAPRAQKHLVLGAACLGVVLFTILAHDLFWERMSTILTTSEGVREASAASRREIARIQWDMAKDFPWGAGHRGNEALSPRYMPAELLAATGRRSAHNTFMAVLVDQGIPGAILFIALHIWGVISLLRLKFLDKLGLPVSLAIYRAMLGTALASLFVSGQFLNLLKAEVAIWLIALLAVLNNLCYKAIPIETQEQSSGNK